MLCKCGRHVVTGEDSCNQCQGLDRARMNSEMQNYKLGRAKYKKRCAELSGSDALRSLQEELVLARMMLEERVNLMKTDADVILAFGQIQNGLQTVERLVKSAHTIEKELAELLSRPTLIQFTSKLSQIILEELKEIDGYEDIIDRINKEVSKAIEEL